jgi:hypothetical protein
MPTVSPEWVQPVGIISHAGGYRRNAISLRISIGTLRRRYKLAFDRPGASA